MITPSDPAQAGKPTVFACNEEIRGIRLLSRQTIWLKRDS
jgi:hypothetical protein